MKKNKKSVSIDDLAIMVAKGFDDVKKELKTEFKTELNFFKVETENNFKNVEDNFKKVRNDILNMGDRFVPRHEFDSFLMRFHRLEQKVDGKSAK